MRSERNFFPALVPMVFACLVLYSCTGSKQEGNPPPKHTPLVNYIQPPGSVPKNLTFEYERTNEDVQKLKAGVGSLKKGDSEADVAKLLGPPNRQGSWAPKESTKIIGHFYVYDIRLVKTGTANVFDQQLSCDFDLMGKLLQIESTVPEIR